MEQRHPPATPGPVTRLLGAEAGINGEERLRALLPLIYDELRTIARRQLAREQERHSLCTTSLVHEAYLKLVDDNRVSSKGRAYFFASAAQAMRRIVVDHARARSRDKRGGYARFTLLDEGLASTAESPARIVELDDALERLAQLSERQVRIVECRVFVGLDVKETAAALEISPRTVKRDWAVARAWLRRTLRQDVADVAPS